MERLKPDMWVDSCRSTAQCAYSNDKSLHANILIHALEFQQCITMDLNSNLLAEEMHLARWVFEVHQNFVYFPP
jgi:hypothetical protein